MKIPSPSSDASSEEEPEPPGGRLVQKKGICGICPAGCWVEVGLRDGRLETIVADDSHTLGMICRRGQHAPEIVYSEHRLKHPMRRKGPKGTYEFERISWDTAYEMIVERLRTIKQESGPEAVAVYTGRGAFELSLCDLFQPKGVAVSSASSVLFPFGSPNTMGVGALCYVSFAMIAPHVTMGRMLVNMFTDIENAELMLIWGANPATDSPPLDMHRLERAAQRGAEIVVIDPRRSETAKRLGAEWIAIRPGTDGALALSLIQVLLEEDLHDEPFADEWTHGLDKLQIYVRHFTPEKTAAITGVSPETIRRLARRIAGARGACPVMYTGLEYSNSGIQAIRAIHTLFALAGQLDTPGGIGLAMPDSQFPINRSCNVKNPDVTRAIARDRFPVYTDYRGESHASGLVDAVLEGDPYRIRGLIVHGASLLTSWPQSSIWRETLAQLEFLVCIDRQLTADAAYADLVLPATTMFEIQSYMAYGPLFRIRERLIEPVGEARNDYLIMAELAARLGYGDQYPQTEEEMLEFVLRGSGHTPEDVRRNGGWVKLPTGMMEYRKWEKGKLRPDGRPGFDTPTGKFEIWSTILEEHGHEPLPKYVEPKEGPQARPDLVPDYPLVFNSGARPDTDFRSQHHAIPGLLKDNPEPCVFLNPIDAEERGIEAGDLVEVRTPRGSVPLRARVTGDQLQGAVECNMGGGTPVGPKAWQEGNVNELTDLGNHDEISGFPVYKALLCDVARLESADAESVDRARKTGDATGLCQVASPAPGAIEKRDIYLDNNATTRLGEEVREAMLPYLVDRHGNPSSIHTDGRTARDAIELARRKVARLLGARPRRIIFCGSGSEANNLALKGVAFAKGSGHVVTTAVEHPSILGAASFLERNGFEATYLRPDEDGRIGPDQLNEALRDDTILVSVMMANNEVGTILPIRELCDVAHARGVLFHTDAVQAAGRIAMDVAALGVDLLTVSGHKLHGPKGVGALYVRKNVPLEPLIHGGSQENHLRAGTENVAGIVGLGKAAEIALHHLGTAEKIGDLRDLLHERVKQVLPDARLNGDAQSRLPNTLNLTLPGLRGESLVVALDQRGIGLASGSACKSGSPDPTHVLLAMGRTEEEAHCSVRFSLSHRTSREDIEATAAALEDVLEEMETTVRFIPCK